VTGSKPCRGEPSGQRALLRRLLSACEVNGGHQVAGRRTSSQRALLLAAKARYVSADLTGITIAGEQD